MDSQDSSPHKRKKAQNPSFLGEAQSQIMNPKQAAQYLGFHPVTLYRLVKSQRIPAMKIGGQWRFRKDVLDAWMIGKMNEDLSSGTSLG